MIAAVDVDYRDSGAVAACVLFRAWDDAVSASETVIPIAHVEPYEPGQFYRRELPCLLAMLQAAGGSPDIVIVDGYVWLADERDPGLGAHLHQALAGRAAVVGVAKTRFASAGAAREILRGTSRHPLYITAAGIDVDEAASHVRAMHGPHRTPTLLKRVDQLCRGRAAPA